MLPNTLNPDSKEGKEVFSKVNDDSKKGEGYVSVRWNKYTFKNQNWRGKIRFEWGLKYGNDAIIARGLASSYNSLGHKHNPNNIHLDWRIIFMKENQVNKFMTAKTTMLNKNFWENLFPQNFNAKDYWGFYLDTDKVCRLNNSQKCVGDPENS